MFIKIEYIGLNPDIFSSYHKWDNAQQTQTAFYQAKTCFAAPRHTAQCLVVLCGGDNSDDSPADHLDSFTLRETDLDQLFCYTELFTLSPNTSAANDKIF